MRRGRKASQHRKRSEQRLCGMRQGGVCTGDGGVTGLHEAEGTLRGQGWMRPTSGRSD